MEAEGGGWGGLCQCPSAEETGPAGSDLGVCFENARRY